MFSLAHISDIHLPPLPTVTRRDLMSKRITGYMNWQHHRAKEHSQDTLSALVNDILAHKPDHIAITGDLVNLGLDTEFDATHKWLTSLGASQTISVVPGNHDAYVRGALRKALAAWDNCMPIEITNPNSALNHAFPYMRRQGPVAIIGVSSAVASAPFLAIGRFQKDQADRLCTLLNVAKNDGLFRVILIHHPPFRYQGDAAKRLYGIRLFQNTVLESGAELVLHGHTHIPSFQLIGQGPQAIPVVGVPSASQIVGGHKPAARWNEFKIHGTSNNWSCQWTERGIQSNTIVTDLGTRLIWRDGQLCHFQNKI